MASAYRTRFDYNARQGNNYDGAQELWRSPIAGRPGVGMGGAPRWGAAPGFSPVFRTPIATETECCVC